MSARAFAHQPVEVLTVKASGYDLRTIGPAGFCDVRLADVLPLRSRVAMSDKDMVAYFARCLVDPGAPRPSIETLLHAFLPFPHVDHTHADAACALATAEQGEAIVRELFGNEALWIPYVLNRIVVRGVGALKPKVVVLYPPHEKFHAMMGAVSEPWPAFGDAVRSRFPDVAGHLAQPGFELALSRGTIAVIWLNGVGL